MKIYSLLCGLSLSFCFTITGCNNSDGGGQILANSQDNDEILYTAKNCKASPDIVNGNEDWHPFNPCAITQTSRNCAVVNGQFECFSTGTTYGNDKIIKPPKLNGYKGQLHLFPDCALDSEGIKCLDNRMNYPIPAQYSHAQDYTQGNFGLDLCGLFNGRTRCWATIKDWETNTVKEVKELPVEAGVQIQRFIGDLCGIGADGVYCLRLSTDHKVYSWKKREGYDNWKDPHAFDATICGIVGSELQCAYGVYPPKDPQIKLTNLKNPRKVVLARNSPDIGCVYTDSGLECFYKEYNKYNVKSHAFYPHEDPSKFLNPPASAARLRNLIIEGQSGCGIGDNGVECWGNAQVGQLPEKLHRRRKIIGIDYYDKGLLAIGANFLIFPHEKNILPAPQINPDVRAPQNCVQALSGLTCFQGSTITVYSELSQAIATVGNFLSYDYTSPKIGSNILSITENSYLYTITDEKTNTSKIPFMDIPDDFLQAFYSTCSLKNQKVACWRGTWMDRYKDDVKIHSFEDMTDVLSLSTINKSVCAGRISGIRCWNVENNEMTFESNDFTNIRKINGNCGLSDQGAFCLDDQYQVVRVFKGTKSIEDIYGFSKSTCIVSDQRLRCRKDGETKDESFDWAEL